MPPTAPFASLAPPDGREPETPDHPDRPHRMSSPDAPHTSPPGSPPGSPHTSPPAVAPGSLRIGLLSDTHGWLDPSLLDHFAGAAHIVHAGDVGSPAVLAQLAGLAPVTAVRGNIDSWDLARLPLEALPEIGPHRLAVLHIAGSPRRPRPSAVQLIRRGRPAAIVVGHSHMPAVARVEGALWINPGAAGHHGIHAQRTAALLDMAPDGTPTLYRIVLGPRGRRRSST